MTVVIIVLFVAMNGESMQMVQRLHGEQRALQEERQLAQIPQEQQVRRPPALVQVVEAGASGSK